MKNKNTNLAQNKRALKWLLKSVDPKLLLAFFKNKSNGAIVDIGGFRMNADSFSKPIVLVKLEKELAKDSKRFNLLLKDESMPWNPYVKLIPALDEDWLIEHLETLFEVLGDRYLLVALAADIRPRVDKLAISFCEDPEIWSQELTPKVENELLSIFKPFATKDSVEKPTTALVNPNELKKLTKRIEAEKERQSVLIAEKKEMLKEHDLQVHLLKEEQKTKLKVEKQKVADLQKQISEMTENSESQIQDAVNRYKAEVLHFSVEEEQESLDRNTFSVTESLISVVDKQLDIHAAHNKKYGTYSRIRQQITSLEKALTRINCCLSESLLVDEKLVQLKIDLQKQIQTLKSLPKIRESFEIEVNKYRELIDQLPLVHGSLDRLNDFKMIFKNPEINLLFGTKPGGLEKLITDKKDRIETILAEKSMAGFTHETTKKAQVTNVKKMLSKQALPFYCLIDGCNLILNHAFRNGFGEESNQVDRRHHLKQDCLKVAADWEKVIIAYDSQSTVGSIENDGNVETVFVDKLTEDQNADNYIMRRLEVLNRQQVFPSQICVVTADRDLQIRTQSYCENIVRPESFLQYLLSE